MSVTKLAGLFVQDAQWLGKVYAEPERLEAATLIEMVAEPVTPAMVANEPSLLASVEVMLTGWGAPRLDRALLDAAPRLRAVFYAGGSVAGTVTDPAFARGVRVSSAYAANAIPVAEYCLASILFSLKHGWRYVRAYNGPAAYPLRPEVPGAYGRTVGLVSLGMIGRALRERLRTCDLDVIAYDPFVSKRDAELLGVRLVSLDELFSLADVVSVHTPMLEETAGLIEGRHFEMMRPGSTFINTSRGGVVREAEMVDVLLRRPDLQAVLDVADPEPPVAGSPLYSMANVVMTPHIAGAMGGECRRLGRYMIDELRRYVSGAALLWEVTPTLAERSSHRLTDWRGGVPAAAAAAAAAPVHRCQSGLEASAVG